MLRTPMITKAIAGKRTGQSTSTLTRTSKDASTPASQSKSQTQLSPLLLLARLDLV